MERLDLILWGAVLNLSVIPPVVAATPLATIQEIHGTPVTVVTPQVRQAAQVGMELSAGEQIHTGSRSRAQLKRQDGFFVRVGSNAILTIVPNNQFTFFQGQMITWVERPLNQQVRIVTPMAVAAIQGTTVFVDAPEHGRWARFFSWEGTVTVSLPDGSQSVTLTSGESVIVPANSLRIPQPYRPSPEVLRQRFQDSVLLHDFDTPMGTLEKIAEVVHSQDARQ